MASLGGFLGGLASGSVGSASVQMFVDTTGVDAGLAKTQASVTKSTTAMGAASTKFAQLAGLMYAAAGAAAIKFAVDSVGAALEAQEAQSKLSNSISNSAEVSQAAVGAFNAQGEAIRKLTGADDEAITSAQAFLVQMGLTEDQITSLIPLIVDLSTKMGIDMETAAKAVGKSVNGTTGSLGKMGIQVDQTAAETDAYAATLDALGAVQGYAAQKAEDEPWIKLRSTFEELQEQVGQQLLPAIKELTETLVPLAEDVGPLVADVALKMAESLGTLSGAVRILKGDFEGLLDVNIGLLGSIMKHIPGMESLGAAFESIQAPLNAYNKRAEESTGVTEDLTKVAFEAAGPMAKLSEVVRGTGGSVKRFGNMSEEGLKQFREATLETFTVTDDVFADLADRSKVTARTIIRELRRQTDALRDYQDNLETAQRKGLEDDVIQALSEQGLEGMEIMEALAHGTRGEIEKVNKSFDSATDQSGLLVGSMTNVKTTVDKLNGAKANVEVDVHYSISGVNPADMPGLGNQP